MKPSGYRLERMTTKRKISAWLAFARETLNPTSDQPGVEAQVLVAHHLQQTRAWVAAHPDYELTAAQQAVLDDLLRHLSGGTPLPYLVGKQEFYGLAFTVTPDVLIPRPETELLVETALKIVHRLQFPRIVDVGAGSGCIAVTLAKHLPQAKLTAIDRSRAALEVARQNARTHGVEHRVHFLQGDLLSAFNGPFDAICANLPYIPSSTLAQLAVNQHEPSLALDGGPDGLTFIRRLLSDAPRVLNQHAFVLLEMEYRQGPACLQLAGEAFPNANVAIKQDFSGQDRLLVITF